MKLLVLFFFACGITKVRTTDHKDGTSTSIVPKIGELSENFSLENIPKQQETSENNEDAREQSNEDIREPTEYEAAVQECEKVFEFMQACYEKFQQIDRNQVESQRKKIEEAKNIFFKNQRDVLRMRDLLHDFQLLRHNFGEDLKELCATFSQVSLNMQDFYSEKSLAGLGFKSIVKLFEESNQNSLKAHKEKLEDLGSAAVGKLEDLRESVIELIKNTEAEFTAHAQQNSIAKFANDCEESIRLVRTAAKEFEQSRALFQKTYEKLSEIDTTSDDPERAVEGKAKAEYLEMQVLRLYERVDYESIRFVFELQQMEHSYKVLQGNERFLQIFEIEAIKLDLAEIDLSIAERGKAALGVIDKIHAQRKELVPVLSQDEKDPVGDWVKERRFISKIRLLLIDSVRQIAWIKGDEPVLAHYDIRVIDKVDFDFSRIQNLTAVPLVKSQIRSGVIGRIAENDTVQHDLQSFAKYVDEVVEKEYKEYAAWQETFIQRMQVESSVNELEDIRLICVSNVKTLEDALANNQRSLEAHQDMIHRYRSLLEQELGFVIGEWNKKGLLLGPGSFLEEKSLSHDTFEQEQDREISLVYAMNGEFENMSKYWVNYARTLEQETQEKQAPFEHSIQKIKRLIPCSANISGPNRTAALRDDLEKWRSELVTEAFSSKNPLAFK